MKIWAIRKTNGDLWLCNRFKPFKDKGSIAFYDIDSAMQLDRDMFPEVTFENSPREVEIKIL